MRKRGIDIAWARPSLAEILATGATWVARYFSPDATKNLRVGEVVAYGRAGLGIVTVWEGTAARALDGFAAGQADARAAEQQRAAVGLPNSHIHHFAVDTDTDWPSVSPYFAGVYSVIGKSRTGVYGGIRVITGAHDDGIRYLWQTLAWSGGQWHPAATIRQPGGTVLQGDADIDEALVTDYGQYPRPTTEDTVLPQDKTDIINGTVAGVLAGIQSGPIRDELAYANLWWFKHILDGSTTAGMSPDQASLITDIHRLVTQLHGTTPPPKTATPAAAAEAPTAPAQ